MAMENNINNLNKEELLNLIYKDYANLNLLILKPTDYINWKKILLSKLPLLQFPIKSIETYPCFLCIETDTANIERKMEDHEYHVIKMSYSRDNYPIKFITNIKFKDKFYCLPKNIEEQYIGDSTIEKYKHKLLNETL